MNFAFLSVKIAVEMLAVLMILGGTGCGSLGAENEVSQQMCVSFAVFCWVVDRSQPRPPASSMRFCIVLAEIILYTSVRPQLCKLSFIGLNTAVQLICYTMLDAM